MRRGINVKEQREEKNYDVAEVDKGRSIQRERDGKRGRHAEQQAWHRRLSMLTARLFLVFPADGVSPAGAALPRSDPAVEGAARRPVMKGSRPETFCSAASLTHPYVGAHQHTAGLNNTFSLMTTLPV